jgi:hypothetical protein
MEDDEHDERKDGNESCSRARGLGSDSRVEYRAEKVGSGEEEQGGEIGSERVILRITVIL